MDFETVQNWVAVASGVVAVFTGLISLSVLAKRKIRSLAVRGTLLVTAGAAIGSLAVWSCLVGPFSLKPAAGPGPAATAGAGVHEKGATPVRWSSRGGRRLLPVGGSARCGALSADARVAVVADESGNLMAAELGRDGAGPSPGWTAGEVDALAIGGGPRYLLAGGRDGRLALLDALNGDVAGEVASPSPVVALALSPDGRLAASAHWDDSVRLWSVGPFRELGRLRARTGVSALAFSADGGEVALAGRDGTLSLWSASTRTFLRHLGPGAKGAPSGLGPLGLDPADGTGPFRTASRIPEAVTALALAADGQYLAAAGADGSVRLWDAATGAERLREAAGAPVLAVGFTPQGDLAVVAGDGTAHAWKVAAAPVQ